MNVAAGKPEDRREKGYYLNVDEIFSTLLYFVEKDISCHVLGIGPSVAPMATTSDGHLGDEWYIDMLVATSGGLQVCRSTGRERDSKVVFDA